ncbi:MAG TPA: thiamine pyrophosphate-dependent enzyme [Alphaproteobacteria bacterium]
MIRIDCLKALKAMLPDDTLVVVTLGVTTDEFYDLGHRDASMYLPAMGCNTPVGLGLATALPHRRVLVLDSDGSLLMSLGILTTVAAQAPRNLGIIVFDNQCYESIGGSPTPSAAGADLAMMARGAGIKDSTAVADLAGFKTAAQRALNAPGPIFVNARIEPSIQRVTPKTTDIFEDKYHFARYIERAEGVEILTPAVRGRRAAQAFSDPAKPPS